MHLNVNHAFLDSNIHKWISKLLGLLVSYIPNDNRLINMWFMVNMHNWFNQNIKYMKNVNFKIKS